MKLSLFCSVFFFAATNSIAQTSVPDTTIHIRGEADYYIDGVLIRRSGEARTQQKSTRKFDSCKIRVITGGIPGTYGDLNTVPVPAIPREAIISDKEQKLATE